MSSEKKQQFSSSSVVNIIGIFMLVGICGFLFWSFSRNLSDTVYENEELVNRAAEYNKCIDDAELLGTQTEIDAETKLCATEYVDVLQIAYDECITEADTKTTKEFKDRVLQECQEKYGKYLDLAK